MKWFARKGWAAGIAIGLLAYLLLVRWLALGYLYEHDLLGGFTRLIDAANRLGKVNFADGVHPLSEYRERADIWLVQASLLAAAALLLRHVWKSRLRVLLLAVNLFSLFAVLSALELALRTDLLQARLGSARHAALSREIDRAHQARANSLGFTDRERDRAGRPGTYRIAVLGDSFVWGAGLADLDDVWSHVLERKLVERHGESVELMSFGRNGWSTADQLAFLKGAGAEFELDLVIVGLVTNDPWVAGVSMPRRGFVWQRLLAPAFVLHPNAFWFVSERWNQLLYGRGYFRDWGYPGWERALYRDENLVAYEQILRELRDHLERRGVEHLVVSLPTVGDARDPRFFLALFELLARNGFRALDLCGPVRERFADYPDARVRDELWANPVDSHPGPPLTEFYAARVLEHLEADFGLSRRVAEKGKR